MLAMYSGQIGSFSSRDLLLFFIMWELELIPVYLLLSMLGGKKRLYSATKFILYTAGASIFLLMGVLGVGLYGSNEPTLNFETSVNQSYPVALEIIFYIGFLIAFAVKLPILPLHIWLPDTHTHREAHYSTSCASIIDTGLNGAILQIISHGFIGAALSFLAGTSYDRIRLVYLDEMGGVAIPMPKIFTMFSSFSMASLALPGMSGFVAEVLVFLGIITSQKYLLMPKIAITFVMAIGMILTPIYLLSMSRQIFYGYKLFNTPNSYVFDSGPHELLVCTPILFFHYQLTRLKVFYLIIFIDSFLKKLLLFLELVG
ncbi:putative NADH:quinone oxidoreductase/Mrp antiporter, membrane subunit [Helianthus annuus]|nr:putative NADH:quinone oxidoreductase/Mrp antiporter, membrane subunit [Helianthus annuus]